MKYLIINQSQQAGIETQVSEPIAKELYDQINRDNIIKAGLVPNMRPGQPAMSDNTLLKSSVAFSDELYVRMRIEGAAHTDIKGIDIHADAINKKTFGCSSYYLTGSTNGQILATALYRQLEAVTPWNDRGIYPTNSFYTLKKSKVCNALIEISFYDNPIQQAWMIQNVFTIAVALRRGVYKTFGEQYLKDSYIDAVSYLATRKIINTPAYWYYQKSLNMNFFKQVLINYYLYMFPQAKTPTYEGVVQYYATCNIIQSPDYWLDPNRANEVNSLFIEHFIISLSNYMKEGTH